MQHIHPTWATQRYAALAKARLLVAGLTCRETEEVFNRAGPTLAVQTLEWVQQAVMVLGHSSGSLGGAIDTIDCVLAGRGGYGGFGFTRMWLVFQTLGLPHAPTYSPQADERFFEIAPIILRALRPILLNPDLVTETIVSIGQELTLELVSTAG